VGVVGVDGEVIFKCVLGEERVLVDTAVIRPGSYMSHATLINHKYVIRAAYFCTSYVSCLYASQLNVCNLVLLYILQLWRDRCRKFVRNSSSSTSTCRSTQLSYQAIKELRVSAFMKRHQVVHKIVQGIVINYNAVKFT
jgi:hypothetical protein